MLSAISFIVQLLCLYFVVESAGANDCILAEEIRCGKFKWHSVIIGVLRQAPDRQLPVKRLRKKVSSLCWCILGIKCFFFMIFV